MSINWDKTDRARMLRFLRHWREDRRYRVSIGENGRSGFDVLNDEAIANLVVRIIRDFWADQRVRARNRAAFAVPASLAFPHLNPGEHA